MSKERLESAMININWHRNKIPPELLPHIDYLTEQADRAQELKNENRILRTVVESNKYIGEQYLEQNKRYRQLLEDIVDEGSCLMIDKIIDTILEVDK